MPDQKRDQKTALAVGVSPALEPFGDVASIAVKASCVIEIVTTRARRTRLDMLATGQALGLPRCFRSLGEPCPEASAGSISRWTLAVAVIE